MSIADDHGLTPEPGGVRLLVIDDEPDDRALVVRELRREMTHPQVTEITGGDELARVLAAPPFDLVVTDYRLRWTDGLAVLRDVKARWPACPVIMFTASGDEAIAVEAMKAGLDDYVLKAPKHSIRLSAAIRSALARARQRQALAEAETRYRSLFDGIPVGLYRTTPDGRFLDANPALVEMLGFPDRAALLAVNASSLYVDPAERRRWQARMEQEGVVREFEARFRRQDGTPIWLRGNARTVRDGEGRVLHYEGALEDVTERKQAEEARRSSEERYRLVFDQSPAGIFHYDTRLRITDCNARFVTIIQSPRERLVGLDMTTLKDQSVLPALRRPLEGQVGFYEGFYRATLSAAEIWVSMRTGPLFDQQGQVLGGVAIVEDVTERRRVEEALAIRTRQLEAIHAISEEITRELDLGALLDLILRREMELVGAPAGGIYLWDNTAQRLIPRVWAGYPDGGWMAGERLGLGEGLVGLVGQERQGRIVSDYRNWPGATRRFLEHTSITSAIGEPLLYRDRLVGVLVLDDGGTGCRFTEGDQALLRLLAPQAAIAIENARLFAELSQSYSDLQRAQTELVRSEKLHAMGQMAAGIAHDMNNMLAAILGQVELLKLQISDSTIRERLDRLDSAATDGAHMVRRLQGFARQQPAGALTPCDLPALVREIVELTRPCWRDEPQRRGIVVEVRTDLAEAPPILGQPAEIREVLTNLILNAVDAMPAGGVLTVAARLAGDCRLEEPGDPNRKSQIANRQSAEMVEVSITDTGVGMSEEVKARIFDPFFTTKGGHGTGLGLSVVYGIMERHGGQIQVASALGQGTTVTLRFQAAPPVAPAVPAPPPPQGLPLRLLLIDDDTMVRQTVAGLLRAAGHTVIEAASGATGLACLAKGSVDMVLTDLGMPEMSGWEVVRAVKTLHPSLPVVLLTGWGEQVGVEAGEAVSGRESGHRRTGRLVDRILGKPFQYEKLLAIIAELTSPPTPDSGA